MIWQAGGDSKETHCQGGAKTGKDQGRSPTGLRTPPLEMKGHHESKQSGMNSKAHQKQSQLDADPFESRQCPHLWVEASQDRGKHRGT